MTEKTDGDARPTSPGELTSQAIDQIAVIGLYNSGSTALAGVLQRLGVQMGAPFWRVSDDDAAENNYEPYDLSWHLRRWWAEPTCTAAVPKAERVGYLRAWVQGQHSLYGGLVGAKHPLLSLSIPDINDAWGARTRIVWSYRPLEESVAALERRGWFGSEAAGLQERLWLAIAEARSGGASMTVVPYDELTRNPRATISAIAEELAILPERAQVASAEAFVLNPPKDRLSPRDKLHRRKLRALQYLHSIGRRSV